MIKQDAEALGLIFGRRSIRVYKPGNIDIGKVRVLLEAAMAAPSAAAKDPWRFVVLQSPERLTQVAGVLPHGRMLATASLGIVVCGDLHAAHDGQLSYMLQDCSAAIENLLLAAHGLGLGGCWLGIHPREERMRDMSRLLRLPSHVVPVSAIALGYPAEEKDARSRFNAGYVHYEEWKA